MKIKIKKKNNELRILANSIEIVNINSVKLDPDNARHNDKNIDKLMKIIKRYGQRTPLTVDSKTKIIYKGNTTFKAMKKLGYSKIAVTLQSFENEQEKYGYSISDNKSPEWTSWNEKQVAKIIQQKFKGVDNSEIAHLTGFEEKEILDFKPENDVSEDYEQIDVSDLMKSGVDYIAIQFLNRKRMEDFRKKVDPKNRHPRVLTYTEVEKYFKRKYKNG